MKRFLAYSAISRSIPKLRTYRIAPPLCLFVVALVGVFGCINRTDAQKLAESGLATASTLASYYDALGQKVDDLVEMEAFNNVLRGLTPADTRSYQEEMQHTKEALQRRSRLARQLAASYQSLKDLSSYDASGEVSNSFGKLSQALAGIPPLTSLSKTASAGPAVDPSQLLSKGLSFLASWKQSRDIDQAVRGMTETLEGLDALFLNELPACQSVAEEHVEKTSVLASELIKKNQVIVWPLLEQDLESIGLKLAHPDQPPNDQAVAAALAAVVQARASRLQTLANSAGQSLLDSLNRQLSSQRQFQAKQGISVSDIQAAIEKANAYLDEMAKQRQSAKH